SATELLNPPPPCFTRAPPHHELMTQPFQPISVISIESQLDKGFPSMAPPSPAQTHPFVVHDVQEEDWTRLLNDVKAAGRISPLNRIMAGVAPAVVGVGIFPGILLSIMMRKKMKQRRQGIVSSIIEHWNLYFFHPRHIEITLAQGHRARRVERKRRRMELKAVRRERWRLIVSFRPY
ncbi:hypothetical protein BDY19DRAFT_875756, partial [Irpex rosettiformis]